MLPGIDILIINHSPLTIADCYFPLGKWMQVLPVRARFVDSFSLTETFGIFLTHYHTMHGRYIAVENIVRKATSNFSFSHNVFHPIWHLFFILGTLTLYSTDNHFNTSTTDSH